MATLPTTLEEQRSPITPEQGEVQLKMQESMNIPDTKLDTNLTQEAFTGNVMTELSKMQNAESTGATVTSKQAANQLTDARQAIDSAASPLPNAGQQMISLDGGMTFVPRTEENLIKQSQMEATKPFEDLQAQRQKQLESQREAIDAQTRNLLAGTEQQQKSSRAAAGMQLARMGALGTTASGLSYIQNLEKTQQAELNNIIQKGRQLITEAEMAYADGDTELALAKAKAAKEAKEEFLKKDQERLETLMKAQKMEIDWGRYEMEQQEFLQKFDKANIEKAQRVAGNIATGLVDLDENAEIVEPTMADIEAMALEANIDPMVLLGQVNARIDALRKMSIEERKFNHARAMDNIQNQLAQDKLGLEYAKFDFDKYESDFNRDLKLREMSLKEQQAKGDEMGLDGEQLQDAVKKGYTTEAQLRLYAEQARKGVDPPAIKEKSAEARKLEGNVLSALSAVSLIRKEVKENPGRGKLLNPLYKSAETNLKDIIGRLRSGGAITEDEFKNFSKLLPGLFQSDATRVQKLQELENNLINTIGKDQYKQAKKEIYADMSTFRQFATVEDKDNFNEFLKVMGASPYDDVSEYFELFREKQDFNQPLSTGKKGSVGSLSSRFESGGDPGRIGYDSTGGWSYGKYQLAHSNAKRFIDESSFKNEFRGIEFNSKAWRDKWQEVAKKNPQAFAKEQQHYIEKTHLKPQEQKLASAGIDLASYSPTFKDVVFSTVVQHGPLTDIVAKVFNRLGKNATEEQLIRAIYDERWSGGKRFASSTPEVKKGVYNRFFGKNGELEQALKMIS